MSVLSQQVQLYRAALVRAALKDTDGNITAAARQLGVHRSHLYAIIQAHGITEFSKPPHVGQRGYAHSVTKELQC
jgi:DNA-binding NtrC family response regulator